MFEYPSQRSPRAARCGCRRRPPAARHTCHPNARRRFKENEMGVLIDGRWHDQWYDTSASGGRFVRQDSVFRNWVTTDGTPGPTGVGGYRAEAGRYHLVSLACPWAHRTLIL